MSHHDLIKSYVNEFFGSNPKELISDPNRMIFLSRCVYITRKSIKYIVHSRQRDGYSSRRIISMIMRCADVIGAPDRRFPNHNKKYPESIISAKLYNKKEALLVIHVPNHKGDKIFNIFYREYGKYQKMLRK